MLPREVAHIVGLLAELVALILSDPTRLFDPLRLTGREEFFKLLSDHARLSDPQLASSKEPTARVLFPFSNKSVGMVTSPAEALVMACKASTLRMELDKWWGLSEENRT